MYLQKWPDSKGLESLIYDDVQPNSGSIKSNEYWLHRRECLSSDHSTSVLYVKCNVACLRRSRSNWIT